MFGGGLELVDEMRTGLSDSASFKATDGTYDQRINGGDWEAGAASDHNPRFLPGNSDCTEAGRRRGCCCIRSSIGFVKGMYGDDVGGCRLLPVNLVQSRAPS